MGDEPIIRPLAPEAADLIGEAASTAEQSAVLGLDADLQITSEPAGAPCATSGADEVVLEINFDPSLWNSIAASDPTFSASCRPVENPTRGPLVRHEVGE